MGDQDLEQVLQFWWSMTGVMFWNTESWDGSSWTEVKI